VDNPGLLVLFIILSAPTMPHFVRCFGNPGNVMWKHALDEEGKRDREVDPLGGVLLRRLDS